MEMNDWKLQSYIFFVDYIKNYVYILKNFIEFV